VKKNQAVLDRGRLDEITSLLSEIVRSGPFLRRTLPRHMYAKIDTLTERSARLNSYLNGLSGKIEPVPARKHRT